MSDSISGVIIPLIIPVDAPSSLASGVQALAASLETTEFSNACLQLQQAFCYLTWHFADYSSRHLQFLGLECTACSAFGHSRLDQHLQALQENLERLAEAAEKHPEVGDVFRVFYVGGLRARHSSPRRHTRLLGLGGQSIRGYRSVLEWCRLELGDEEFSGELRCQRELRRYLPILREWLDSSSGHFRQIKTYEWFDQGSVEPEKDGSPPDSPPASPPAASEVLASLKSPASEAPTAVALTSFPTPPLLARHQALFEEQAAAQSPDAFVTLGRLAGLAVQYIFAISSAALRSIGKLDPALEKRLETGLTLRQKQTSLTFLFKGLAQHQNENPMLEQVTRSLQAPSGGKLADFLTSTWGGGHTFAEFCMETAKPDPPPLWQERFLPGIRAWLQQSASWFAHAEHYFQPPNEQGFVGFTLQLGDEHLEIDRKALLLDTVALRIGPAELKQLLTARTEPSGENNIPAVPMTEPAQVEPGKVEPAQSEPAKVQTPKAEPAQKEPAQTETTPVKPARSKAAQAPIPAESIKPKATPAPVQAKPAVPEPVQAPVQAKPAEPEPVQAPVQTEPTDPEPVQATVQADPVEPEPVQAPVQAEPSEPEPVQAPVQTEPTDPEPVQAPVQAEPAEPEPVQAPDQAEPVEPEPVQAPVQAEPAEPEPVQAPVQAEPAEPEPTLAPAQAQSVEPESNEPIGPEAKEETAESESSAPAQATQNAGAAVAEAVSPPPPSVAEHQSAAAQGWTGPAPALELWDQAVDTLQAEPLLKLIAFLIQYTNGVTDEWREVPEKGAAETIASALDQLLQRLQTIDETPVLTPLGAIDDRQSLHYWLQQAELRNWLTQERNYRSEELAQAGRWLCALQPFFQDSEQLFEEPADCGTLEGVVVYQERFLEFVDHPIYMGPTQGKFWENPAIEAPTLSETTVAVEAQAAIPESGAPPDLMALPACASDYYEALWTAQPVGLEGLASALEFSIQYYAGLMASVAIASGTTEASHLVAWRGDSNLLQRLEMIQQILQETNESDHATLVALREIFEGSVFGEVWKREGAELANLAYSLRCGHEEEQPRASAIMAAWVEASKPLLETLENLAEPIDARGHLEVVIQQEDSFFELVEPEYAIHLVPPGFIAWQDLICYRNLAARYGSQELLGSSDGSQELSGSAVTDDTEDFFSAPSPSLQDKMMEALFKEPEPAATVKLETPKAKPQLVQQEEQPMAPPPRSELQLNAVLEQLLQKPTEEEAPSPVVVSEEASVATAKLEAPKRLDAPATEKQPEFIVVDPPKLQYTIHYDGKEGQIHTGRIELKNVGGSLLKGTVKSNHPCLRVNPSVFRTNEAEINYWIDDSDRPSNMQKIGLSFHFSGQKVEVPMEKMLPDKKFKQLATKMLGFVKNLRQKG